jgi:hypothetical protein
MEAKRCELRQVFSDLGPLPRALAKSQVHSDRTRHKVPPDAGRASREP